MKSTHFFLLSSMISKQQGNEAFLRDNLAQGFRRKSLNSSQLFPTPRSKSINKGYKPEIFNH